MAVTHTTGSSILDINQDRYNPRRPDKVNVGQVERFFSTVGGGALAFYGARRGTLNGFLLALAGGAMMYRGITGRSFLYKAIDMSTFEESPDTVDTLRGNKGIRVRRSMTIERPAADLYHFWNDIEKAPLYMPFIDSVQRTSDRSSHWIAKLPNGTTMEWDSEITGNSENQSISWQATGKALTGTAGKVCFVPTDRGTVVTLEIDLPQLAGTFGASLGKVLGHVPEQQVRESLRGFKELMEAGEIPTIKGQPTGEGIK